MTQFEQEYLHTQYLLFYAQVALIAVTAGFYGQLAWNNHKQNIRERNLRIEHWCKAVFRSGHSSGGQLQSAGTRVRNKYPKKMNVILRAYEELTVEEPNLNMRPLPKFLELMEGCEPGCWPLWSLAANNKLDLESE